jgi:hypothetical protein
MNYSKPQITKLGRTTDLVQSSGSKNQCALDQGTGAHNETCSAYEADE